MFKFLIIFLFAVILLADYYLSRCFHKCLLRFISGLKFWHTALFFGIVTLLMLLAFSGSFLPIGSTFRAVLSYIGFYTMVFYLYFLIGFLLFDVVVLILKRIKPSLVAHRLVGIIGISLVSVLALLVVVIGARNAKSINTIHYDVTVSGKEDVSDINIVMLSDLHIGAVGSEDRLPDIVDAINREGADLVCIVGDIFDSNFYSIKDPDAASETLREIKSSYGVYACLGNHDAGATQSEMISFLERSNITLLAEEYTVIDERLILVGRLDRSPIGHSERKRGALGDFLDTAENNLPIVVMDHNPANIDEYTNDVDVVLSGHTHKGQIFPGSIITSLMYEVDYGYYKREDGLQVIVSSGVGYWGMPVRGGTVSEIVSIRIPA